MRMISLRLLPVVVRLATNARVLGGCGLPSLCELRRDSPRLAQAAFDRAVDEAASQARVVARGEVHHARRPLQPE